MPTYAFVCNDCAQDFERVLTISGRDEPTPCPSCGGTSKRVPTIPNFNLVGDGWPGKNLKIAGQMAEKNRRLDARQNEMKRDAPQMTLAPNVEGERVDSWAEAKKLAADRGKDASTYEAKVREESLKK